MKRLLYPFSLLLVLTRGTFLIHQHDGIVNYYTLRKTPDTYSHLRKDKNVTPLVPLGALIVPSFFAQYSQNRKTTKVVMKKEKTIHSLNSFQLKKQMRSLVHKLLLQKSFVLL